jgi:hypothetical protein
VTARGQQGAYQPQQREEDAEDAEDQVPALERSRAAGEQKDQVPHGEAT